MTKTPTACFIIIGDEILSGRTLEKNLPVLTDLLNKQGIRLTEARIIPDKKDQIIQTTIECSHKFDEVFTSGGIGPTHDDITSASISEALNLPLERHEPTFELLKRNSPNKQCNQMKEKMAWFPKGSTPIENNCNAPPGFSIKNIHVMAGVPAIFKSMVKWLIPQLSKGTPLHSFAWHSFNLSESNFAKDLQTLQENFPNAELGSYPFRNGDKEGVTLVSKGNNLDAVKTAASMFPNIIRKHGGTPHEGDFQS
ncbi:competence/damage-inducible protein A [Acetobacteraceae bacterium]|nr:competence/damage-inducible protein A [Acetobacteraceae bacterium]